MALKMFIILGLVFFLALAWIRLAPSDPARWHVAPPAQPGRARNGAVVEVPGGARTLARLDAIARATPRTRVLAGAIGEGRITYVTRSRLWGFPDYTTLWVTDDGRLIAHARLRFGRSDMGVNAARLDDWLKRLEAVEQ